MKSIKILLLSLIAIFTMVSCDVYNEQYVYQCQISDLQQLGDGEIAPLEMSIIYQGVSLNADIWIDGQGLSIAGAISDADRQARDFFEQNYYMINARALTLIRGKSFNYTLFRFDGPLPNRPVVVSTRRITKK